MSIKEQIQSKLYEIEQLLLGAVCDGEQLAELECFSEVEAAVSTLAQTIDYYVD